LAPLPAHADDPPEVEFQPAPCTVPDKPIALCAGVSDDIQVAKARIYFREAGRKYYSFVEMVFGGINYCGTIPAPKEGKIDSIEYYVQAVDSNYQAKRTSTYQMAIQAEGVCGFPPVEQDPDKASSIVVHATHKKQGKKLHKDFLDTGVTFIPVSR
jgi:hypothetical protein